MASGVARRKAHHQYGSRTGEITRKEEDETGEQEVVGDDGVGEAFSFALNAGLGRFAVLNEAHNL